jgi:hypothetical protein
MKNEKPSVVFRRIRGRIIPIRKKSKEAAQGAALAAGGIVTAVLSGEIASQMVKKSAAMRTEAKMSFNVASRALRRAQARQMKFSFAPGIGARREQIGAATNLRARGAKLFRARNLVLAAGALIGGSMLSEGLERFQKDPMKGSAAGGVATDVAAGTVAYVAGAVYYRRLGVRGLGRLFGRVKARAAGTPRGEQIPIPFKSRIFGKGTLKF